MSKTNLAQLSLNISESEYRELPAVHHTQIKRYISEGFSSLYTTTKPTASLAFGTLIDTLVTSPQEFHNKYVVAVDDFTKKEKEILDYVYENSNNASSVKDINNVTIKMACGLLNKNWNIETKEEKIVKLLNDKYQSYLQYLGKTVLSQEDYQSAVNCANKVTDKLKSLTKDDQQIYYQLKFKQTINGIDYKCMFDIIIVDDDKKLILPLDLKTSSYHEYDFPKAFMQYMYFIQAELYTEILKQVIKDTDFDTYKILPFSFIVINNLHQEPLFWKYDITDEQRALLPDLWSVSREIDNLLKTNADMPINIKRNQFNSLSNNIKIYYNKHENTSN